MGRRLNKDLPEKQSIAKMIASREAIDGDASTT